MKHLVAMTIVAATLAGAASAEQYVCQVEQMTGFTPDDNGGWRDTRFTNRPTYLVDTEALTVTEFGQDIKYTHLECELGGGIMPDWMTCSYSIGTSHFTFNGSVRRFTEASLFGSVGSSLAEPWIAIGSCAALGG